MTASNSYSDDDNWELDIQLGSDTSANIFQRKGVYHIESDKELTLACERYQFNHNNRQHQYYYEDDDTASSVTSVTGGSILSEIVKFSDSMESSYLAGIDDFIYEQAPTSVTMEYDNQKYPGVIKRLSCSLRQVQNNDDWNDDIDLPTSLNMSKLNQPLLQQLDEIDMLEEEELPDIITREEEEIIITRGNNNTVTYSYEPEGDEDDWTGLEFPENMHILPRKLDQIKHSTSPSTSKLIAATTTRIPIPSSVNKPSILASITREKDDDDFCEGLNIKEKAFISINMQNRDSPSLLSINNSNNSLTATMKKQQQSRIPSLVSNNKGKEPLDPRQQFTSSSRLTRTLPLSRTAAVVTTSISTSTSRRSPLQPTTSTDPKRNFQSSTKATLHREAATRMQQKLNNKLTISPKYRPAVLETTTERKNACGYTLIARPKAKATTYCSRLDNIDNLNDLQPTRRIGQFTFRQQLQSKNMNSDTNNNYKKPWRRNMQTKTPVVPSQSKVRLIQPIEKNLVKECNNMTYDQVTHCWKGNEKNFIDLERPARKNPRLMLITNRQKQPSRYAAVVGNSMIFDPELQKWISAHGPEHDELDEIEDLKDESHTKHSTSHQRHSDSNNSPILGGNSSNVLMSTESRHRNNPMTEFRLSVQAKRQMMYEQQQHEEFFEQWPILNQEATKVTSYSGHKVEYSKYLLFEQEFC